MKINNKKGVFGLTSVQAFFTIILGIAMLAYVIVVIMGTLNSSNIITANTLSSSATDNAFINNTGYTLSQSTIQGFSNPSVTATRTAGMGIFGGIDNSLNISNALALNVSNFTACVWQKNTGNYQNASGARLLTAVGFSLAIIPSTNVPSITIFNATTDYVIVKSSALTPNIWYHLCASWNETTASFYENGVLKGTNSSSDSTIKQTIDGLNVGDVDSHVRPFNGTMSNVVIFNRSLSASEIQTLYYNGRQQTNRITDGLVGSYYIQGDSLDSSGLGNNLSNRNVTYGTDTETINSNAYSVSALFIVTNATSITWNSANLSYNFNYGNINTAISITSNTSAGISNFFGAISPVYTILAILVIILVLIVLVRVVTGDNIGMGRESMSPI